MLPIHFKSMIVHFLFFIVLIIRENVNLVKYEKYIQNAFIRDMDDMDVWYVKVEHICTCNEEITHLLCGEA